MENHELFYPRMEWNLIYQTALDIKLTGEKAGIEPRQLVFIGGLSCAFHLRNAFGGYKVVQWRGTNDVDLIVFGSGGPQRLMDAVKSSSQFGGCKNQISHLPDKWSCQLSTQRGKGFFSDQERTVEVDLFGQVQSGVVHLNSRNLEPDKLIYDPPEELEIGNRVKVMAPSLRDTVILKMDILQDAKSLREKDHYDILGCLAVAEKKKIPCLTIASQVLRQMATREQSQRARETFYDIADAVQKGYLSQSWNIPSKRYLRNFLDFERIEK